MKSRILKGFGRGKQVFIGTLGRGKQDFKGLWARKVGFWKSFRAWKAGFIGALGAESRFLEEF